MPLMTPFAQMPATPEPIIAQVRRQLADDPALGTPLAATLLDRVADRAVRDLWESRIKTFVPVLALREAREKLREQDVLITAELPSLRPMAEATAMRNHAERPPRDILPIDGDVLPLDDRESLSH